MLIEVFGLECPKCQTTLRVLKATAKRLGIDAEVKFIKNFKEMDARGVKRTPAVFINGERISEGGVPGKSLAEGWIRGALARKKKGDVE